jgi:hypothetical protein
MSEEVLQKLIHDLDEAARGASVAEETFRREAAERIAALSRARIFAFRRLNLVKTVVAAMAAAEDHPTAMAQARAVFLREVNWTGASESQREVVEKFLPVADAIWDVQQAGKDSETREGETRGGEPKDGESKGVETRDNEERAGVVEERLAAFEQWFERNRSGPFLSLMDGEVLELPLVEVA